MPFVVVLQGGSCTRHRVSTRFTKARYTSKLWLVGELRDLHSVRLCRQRSPSDVSCRQQQGSEWTVAAREWLLAARDLRALAHPRRFRSYHENV